MIAFLKPAFSKAGCQASIALLDPGRATWRAPRGRYKRRSASSGSETAALGSFFSSRQRVMYETRSDFVLRAAVVLERDLEEADAVVVTPGLHRLRGQLDHAVVQHHGHAARSRSRQAGRPIGSARPAGPRGR